MFTPARPKPGLARREAVQAQLPWHAKKTGARAGNMVFPALNREDALIMWRDARG
jgi:hypothetical protein